METLDKALLEDMQRRDRAYEWQRTVLDKALLEDMQRRDRAYE